MYREKYGHFLNQLATVYNCSEKAVTSIVAEITTLGILIHSFIVSQIEKQTGMTVFDG